MRKLALSPLLALLAAAGCSSGGGTTTPSTDAMTTAGSDATGATSDASTSPDADATSTTSGGVTFPDAAAWDAPALDGTGATADFTVGGSRPVSVHVPPGLDPTKAAPLLIMLHGYGVSGDIEEAYQQLQAETDAQGMLYAAPDGTFDTTTSRYWNATDACCGESTSKPDDVAYLTGLVDDIATHHKLDPARIFLIGHSNGGFMSHRMACDRAEIFSAIVSLAGAVWNDASKCKPIKPVSILDIHGDADATILYGGGVISGVSYPSEAQTMGTWAAINGCSATPTVPSAAPVAITSDPISAKTWPGCVAGTEVTLWTLRGGAHIPTLNHPAWAHETIKWLLAHHR